MAAPTGPTTNIQSAGKVKLSANVQSETKTGTEEKLLFLLLKTLLLVYQKDFLTLKILL